MITSRDILGAIRGVFAMARADERWTERLDMSAEAVFRSFWAIPFAILPHLLVVEGSRQLDQVTGAFSFAGVNPVTHAAVQTVFLLIAWGLQLFVLASLAGKRRAGWRVSPLLIGYNWAIFLSRMMTGLVIGVALLIGQPALAGVLIIGVLGFSLWLEWGVLRRALQTGPGPTAGIMFLLAAVSFAVSIAMTLVLDQLGLSLSGDAPGSG
ncbi:MAG: hypothetical protein AAF788_03390 [Pseudomonadota bacterium]